jgi:hypothetical protein
MIQQEQWLLLDDQGKVRANIKRTLDSEGPADSFALWESGEWINLPLATINTASNSLPFDPNYGIYELLPSHQAGTSFQQKHHIQRLLVPG